VTHAELEVSEMLTFNIWASLHSINDWVDNIKQGVYWVDCTSYGEFGGRENSCNTIAAQAGLRCGASQIVPCVHLAPYVELKFVTNTSNCYLCLSFCGKYTHPLPYDFAHIVKFPVPL